MTTINKTIILITGAFVSHTIWEPWEAFFRQKGFTVLVPPWPHKDATPDELRQTLPHNKAFAALRLADVVAHYQNIITSLPEKPIIVGHSLGGLIVQLLVNRGLVAAGVAIHSAPPKGVFSFEWPFLRSIWRPLGFPFDSKVYCMSRSAWNYSVANGLSTQVQSEGYDTYCIPESRRVLRDALSNVAKVDFTKAHPPLLLITGTDDRMSPESLNYENYAEYHKDNYITDYKKFPGRNHYVLALPTWKEEAEYITDWIAILGLM